MDIVFTNTFSWRKFKELAQRCFACIGYGCLTAAGMSAVIFAFAYFTSGMDMFTGIDWVRRVCTSFLLGNCGGVGLLFSGKEYGPSNGSTRDN